MPAIPFMNKPIVLVGIVAAIGIVAFLMFSGGADGFDLPSIPGLTEANVFANVDVDYGVGGLGDADAEIHSVTTYDRTTMMTLPFGAWLPHATFRGVIVVESVSNGHRIDHKEADVDIWAHFWDVNINRITLSGLKLGSIGSGRVQIKMSMYDLDGNLVAIDSTFRDI